MTSQQRVELVVAAVDGVTAAHGLSRGEAVWAFTAMLMTALKDASPDGRDALREGVSESLETMSLKPLVRLGIVTRVN